MAIAATGPTFVNVTVEGGHTLQEFARLIEERSKWLRENTEKSVTAMMMDTLVSLRALTRIASPKKSEIKLSPTPLRVSWSHNVRGPVLRNGKARYTGDEGIIWGTRNAEEYKLCRVWRWHDYKRDWLVVALSEKDAKERAYRKLQKRANAYKGVARVALSLLLKKTGTNPAPDKASPRASDSANRLTRVTKTGSGSNYTIEADDLLDYAKLAFRGIDGDAAIETAMQKACNKVTGLINQRCKDILGFSRLETPFPEVRK